LLHLRVEALAVRRYPCIAVNHAGILLLYSAPEKPFFYQRAFFAKFDRYTFGGSIAGYGRLLGRSGLTGNVVGAFVDDAKETLPFFVHRHRIVHGDVRLASYRAVGAVRLSVQWEGGALWRFCIPQMLTLCSLAAWCHAGDSFFDFAGLGDARLNEDIEALHQVFGDPAENTRAG
jgi:hypothetical protein